jgi:hypothetical protein
MKKKLPFEKKTTLWRWNDCTVFKVEEMFERTLKVIKAISIKGVNHKLVSTFAIYFYKSAG